MPLATAEIIVVANIVTARTFVVPLPESFDLALLANVPASEIAVVDICSNVFATAITALEFSMLTSLRVFRC